MLRSIKLVSNKVDKLMSYRYYRLMIRTDSRSSRDTAAVSFHMKILNLKMINHVFDGNDTVKIFEFLTRFLNEAEVLNISQPQAFIAIPRFLADRSETQFRTNLSGSSRHIGEAYWPKAIDLLPTYADA